MIFQENPAVQKRLAVLHSQLKKAEASKKTYEVATEKLLAFAEVRIILYEYSFVSGMVGY